QRQSLGLHRLRAASSLGDWLDHKTIYTDQIQPIRFKIPTLSLGILNRKGKLQVGIFVSEQMFGRWRSVFVAGGRSPCASWSSTRWCATVRLGANLRGSIRLRCGLTPADRLAAPRFRRFHVCGSVTLNVSKGGS